MIIFKTIIYARSGKYLRKKSEQMISYPTKPILKYNGRRQNIISVQELYKYFLMCHF